MVGKNIHYAVVKQYVSSSNNCRVGLGAHCHGSAEGGSDLHGVSIAHCTAGGMEVCPHVQGHLRWAQVDMCTQWIFVTAEGH